MKRIEDEAKRAVEYLIQGKIIVYPTDTVWGIGCLITFPESIQTIYKIVQRPAAEPMVLLVESIEMLKNYVHSIHPRIETLMTFHTKPLTIVYPKAKNLHESIQAKNGSIAIRVCTDAFCKRLLELTQTPLVSISAHMHNQAHPKHFLEINRQLIEACDYVVSYRQDELNECQPSVIITYNRDGEIRMIRS